MDKVTYRKGHLASCALDYGRPEARRVVRGRRLGVPYVFAADRKTPICYCCHSERLLLIMEPQRIDLGPHARAILDPLTHDEVPIREDEYAKRRSSVYVCTSCGKWLVEQNIIGEDFEYVVQVDGALDFFSEPRDIPAALLCEYLITQRLRLRDIPPERFERLVEEFLRAEWKKAEVRHVGAKGGVGDGGVDLFLVVEDETYLIQVKHHPRLLAKGANHREGVQFVRELNGVLFRDGKTKGMFVTSAAGYTADAIREVESTERAHTNYQLLLLDRSDLSKWVNDTGFIHCSWNAYLTPGQHPHQGRSVFAEWLGADECELRDGLLRI